MQSQEGRGQKAGQTALAREQQEFAVVERRSASLERWRQARGAAFVALKAGPCCSIAMILDEDGEIETKASAY